MSLVLGGGTAHGVTTATDGIIARAGLLTLGDLSSGWARQPNNVGGGAAVLAGQLVSTVPTCRKYRSLIAAKAKEPKLESPIFASVAGGVALQNAVTVLPTVAAAASRFAIETTAGYTTCYRNLLARVIIKAAAQSGQRVANVGSMLQLVKPPTTAGDSQAAFVATVSITVRGVTATIYFETVGVRVGRVVEGFSFESMTAPIADIMPSAIAASAGRLATAQQ